jgi:PAS domain-containing protein
MSRRTSTPPRPLVAALRPEPRTRVDRAVRTSAAVLAGLGAGAVLLLIAELHVDGPAGIAIRAGVIVALAALLGLAVARLRARIEVMQAIRRGQDAMGQGIVLVDPDTLRVVHATAAAAAFAGRPAAQLVGRTPSDAGLVDEDEVAEVAAALRAGRDPYRLLVTRGGRTVSWTARRMRGSPRPPCSRRRA